METINFETQLLLLNLIISQEGDRGRKEFGRKKFFLTDDPIFFAVCRFARIYFIDPDAWSRFESEKEASN